MEQDVLGIAFDGTGYGTDGTVWGGEFLLASKTDFRRVASLLPFFLPGGDAAIRQPWRVAVSLLTAAMPDVTPGQIAALLIHRDGYTRPSLVQIHQVQQLIGSGSGTVTSSMGRLFDGVAALLLGIGSSNFEGEPAMRLESQCDESDDASPYRAELETTDTLIRINWLPLVRAIVADIQAGCLASVIAMRFHRSIANAVGIVAEDFPGYAVVLSGGCFQNRVLTELVIDRLRQQYRIVAPPGTIPPNDGGLAAGQIAIAAAQLEAEEQRRTTACA